MTLVQRQAGRSAERTIAARGGANSPRHARRRSKITGAAFAVLALLAVASSASAIVITGGPTYTPPNGGSCSLAGEAKLAGGATWTCTVPGGAYSNLYIGIKNNNVPAGTSPQGESMDSTEPTGAEIFAHSATGATTITYTGTTSVFNAVTSSFTTAFTRLTLTFTGSGSMVTDSTTIGLSNSNGAVHSLWRTTAAPASFTVNALLEASDAAGGPFVPALTYFGTPGLHGKNTRSGIDTDRSHVDIGFYYSTCGDSTADTNFGAEQCDLGGSNGSSTSCCTSTCQFRASGQVCRTSTGECDPQETCTGSAATCPANGFTPSGTLCTDTSPPSTGNCKSARCNGGGLCDQNFANETNGTVCDDSTFCNGSDSCSAGVCSTHTGNPCAGHNVGPNCNDSCNETADNCTASDLSGTSCAGNGVNECSGADSCNGIGSCLNNDVAAGTSCTDTSPPSTGNCKDARCSGSGGCDQNFTDETNGTACDDGLFCDGTETCSTGVCTNSTGDPCPGPDNDLDCSESCNESADDCSADDPDGTTCRPDTGQCDVVETCLSGACPADGFESSGTPCGSVANTECTDPDTCDGNNNCQANDETSGTPCGDPSDTVCDNPDTCDGSGTCAVHNEPNTLVCRPATTGGTCDEVELCDGAGSCPADGFESNGTPCRADTGDCDVPEACTGSSPFCPADGFESSGTACGDPTNTDCDDPDTCDGNNNCEDNLVSSGTACGDPTNTACDNPDTCDGGGTCEDNLELSGTACGDPSNTVCTDPDTCDGSGLCLANNASNGTLCDDGSACTAIDSCTNGICVGGAGTCPLDHYKCYQGKDLKNPKFIKRSDTTDDQIIPGQTVESKKLKFVCVPVDKNGEGVNDPNAHLACYLVKAASLAPRPRVEVVTQFQTSQFQLKKAKLICLPATKTVLP